VVADVGNTLKSFGVQQEQINAVVSAIDPGQLVALVGAVLSSTLGVLSNVFFLILLLFFMAFDTDSTRRSVAGLGNRMPDLAAALSSFARGARRYMSITAGFGFIVAVIDGTTAPKCQLLNHMSRTVQPAGTVAAHLSLTLTCATTDLRPVCVDSGSPAM
jgi:hypothetical protein